ncbi:MAG: RagB/SusD family nutrient uptake outer membrane protein, partial [Bacteroides sp.]
DKAAEVGAELVNNKDLYGYDLVSDYNSLFSLAGEQNKEVILAARAKLGIENAENKWLAHVLTSDYPTTDNLAKWGGYKITWSFYEQYTKGFINIRDFRNDTRRERIIAEYTGKDDKGNPVLHNKENDAASGLLRLGVIPIKYEIAGTVGEDSSIDVPIYRFADVMTLYGEALVRRDNEVSPTAMEMLNAVRRRAGVREYPMQTSVDGYLSKMLKERGIEFYFEGCRRQDLIRYGKFIEVAVQKAKNAGYSTAKIEHMEDGVYKYHRLPIPPYIVDEGKGLIKQNPGY